MADGTDRRDWEDLARLDPYWAVLTDERRRFGGWDAAELLATGADEISGLLSYLDGLGVPAARHAALDHGCGVGRLTRALATHFEETTGVDISPAMLAEARELNSDVPNVRFAVAADLDQLDAGSFDLVYSNLVLQHSSSAEAVLSQVASLARLVAPEGALVFQVPARIPPRRRVQLRRRLFRGLRSAGVPPEFLYRRLRLHPMHMRAVRNERVLAALAAAGATVIRVDRETWPDGVVSATYIATVRPT
jgi:SAM-dependent methyltransferase